MCPPDPWRSLQLVGRILSLQMLGDPQQTKFLLNGVEPLISLQWFLSHLEDWRLRIQKLLECTMLIWLGPWLMWVAASSVLRDEAQSFLHCPLAPQELGKELLSRRWRWGWLVIMVAILAATSSSTGARHLRNCNNKRLLVDAKRLQMNCIIMPN